MFALTCCVISLLTWAHFRLKAILSRVTPRLKRGERRFLATEFLFKILFQKWRLFCCRLDSFFGGVFDFDHDWTWRFRLRFWLQVLDQTSSIPIPPRFLMSFAMKTLSLRLKRRSLRLKVPSPFLNKIKTWLRIFLEPKKQVSSLQSVENWAVSGEKIVSFLALSFFFNRAKMFPCEKLNQFLSVFVTPTRRKSLFFGCRQHITSAFPFTFNKFSTNFVAPTRLKNLLLGFRQHLLEK